MRTFFLTVALLVFSAVAAAETVAYTEAELLMLVQQHTPERFERLMRLKDRDPARYEQALERIEAVMLEREDRKAERSAQATEMRQRKKDLLAAYEGARSERSRAEIRAEMEQLTLEHLQMKLALKQERLTAARARLEAMEAELAAKEAELENIAAEMVEAYLQDLGEN